MKKVFILGSTGSIGVSAISVCENLGREYRVVGISGYKNYNLLAKQSIRLKPHFVVFLDSFAGKRTDFCGRVFLGNDGLREALAESEPDIVVNAIWGTGGIEASLLAVEYCKTLALANKESMVVVGPILLSRARAKKCRIIPIDSEHSAIFQALLAGRCEEVRRVILTASGGPLLKFTKRELNRVTPAQALRHPVWSMGKRITLDSATLMNKALEMIEAKYLFDLEPGQIEVVIHPESVIHSIVEFCDSSMVAQMSVPDMRVAIQYALTYPRRFSSCVSALDLVRLKKMTFFAGDEGKFPALRIGRRALEAGGTSGAVVTAANEVAAQAFLDGRIGFPQIVQTVLRVLDSHRVICNPGIVAVKKAQLWARAEAERIISRFKGGHRVEKSL